MSKTGNKENKKSEVTECPEKAGTTLGRKRDHTLDTRIIEAALEMLAEVGFDSMTMDMIAARAKAGKATVYRRWDSKEELVRDALVWMSQTSVELDALPATGTLRGDLLALLKPYSVEYSKRKLRILSGLGSFFCDHQKLAQEATAEIFEPWMNVNRLLMQRAIDRGEIPAQANIEMACQVIISMTFYHSFTQGQPFDEPYAALIDHILLPALKNPKQSD